MPKWDAFDSPLADNFASYRLRIGGLVEQPREFSLAELRAMPKQEQITTHFCIQGWSGVAKWGGVPMRHISIWCARRRMPATPSFTPSRMAVMRGRYYDVHRWKTCAMS